MENEKLLYGKRLIVDFMDIKPKSVIPNIYYWNDAPFFYVSETTPELVMDAIVKYVKYHSSWDSLIPVIIKCINIIGIKTIDECSDYEWKLFNAISNIKVSTPITIAFEITIEFIEWYNKNK